MNKPIKDYLELNPKFDHESRPEYYKRIHGLLENDGHPWSLGAIRKAYYRGNFEKRWKGRIKTDAVHTNFDWKEIIDPAQAIQKVFNKSSGSQDFGTWQIETDEPICVLFLADLHIGSYGTDMTLFREITNEIIETKNLFIILGGDLLQMAIKMRSVAEVTDNLLPPKFQLLFLDSWLKDIQHKVIASTWDNHAVMREESLVGYSMYSHIFERMKNVIYHKGIGHLDLIVGKQRYKTAVSHFFSGRSIYNPVHAGERYMLFKANDREITMQGHTHEPGILEFVKGGKKRVSMNCGTLHTNCGYAKRFFTLKTHPVFPCIEFDPHEHRFTPFWSVKDWLNFRPQNKE